MIKNQKEEDQIRANIKLCKDNVKTAISELQKISKKIGGNENDVKPLQEGLNKVSDKIFSQLLKTLNAQKTQEIDKDKKG
jgi:hypothetical protein